MVPHRLTQALCLYLRQLPVDSNRRFYINCHRDRRPDTSRHRHTRLDTSLHLQIPLGVPGRCLRQLVRSHRSNSLVVALVVDPAVLRPHLRRLLT